MNRVKHFCKNAGSYGLLQIGVFVAALVFLTVQDLRAGRWMYTVPVFLLTFFLG
jgi:hypothetical protein